MDQQFEIHSFNSIYENGNVMLNLPSSDVFDFDLWMTPDAKVVKSTTSSKNSFLISMFSIFYYESCKNIVQFSISNQIRFFTNCFIKFERISSISREILSKLKCSFIRSCEYERWSTLFNETRNFINLLSI